MQNMKRANASLTKVKLFLAFITCLLFVLSNFFIFNFHTAFADEAQPTNRTVTAGIFSFEGYHMKDEHDSLTGYGIEFLNLVSEYSHLNFEYTGYEKSWDDMLTMLKNNKIDVVTSARRTDEREKDFDFSLPIGRNKTVLSIQVDNETLRRGAYST